jgi:DNA-nicking Smr family endonuclease
VGTLIDQMAKITNKSIQTPGGRAKVAPALHALSDLKAVKQALQARAAEQAVQAAQAAQLARQRDAEANLFKNAAGAVAPLRAPARLPRAAIQPPPPAPLPRQQQRDEQAVLQESLSDEFDFSSLLETDDQLSYRQAGIGADVLKKLRRGDWSIQAELDLHGLRQDEARSALGQFLRDAAKQGLRCVRVVHGKGLGSPGKTPVLKGRVQGWLVQKKAVLAFVQAKPADGGAGALVALLAGT